MKATKLRIGPSFELRFDPGSRRAISIGANISVWDLETRKRIVRSHPLKHPSHVRWSPSGDSLAVKSTSGELVIVDATTLAIISRLQSRQAGEGCETVFSPDGHRLLDGTWDGLLATYDIEAQSRQLEHTFPQTMITSIVSSRSDTYAAAVIRPKASSGLPQVLEHAICLAEWSDSGLALRTVPKKFHGVKALAFDRTEKLLAIMRNNGPDEGGTIEIIEVEHGQSIASRPCVLSHNGSSIDWSPDNRLIGTVDLSGFRFYAATDLTEIIHVPWKYPSHVEFSGDGKYVAFGAWSGGEIRLVNTVIG
jgi:WD40 repeat protein